MLQLEHTPCILLHSHPYVFHKLNQCNWVLYTTWYIVVIDFYKNYIGWGHLKKNILTPFQIYRHIDVWLYYYYYVIYGHSGFLTDPQYFYQIIHYIYVRRSLDIFQFHVKMSDNLIKAM